MNHFHVSLHCFGIMLVQKNQIFIGFVCNRLHKWCNRLPPLVTIQIFKQNIPITDYINGVTSYHPANLQEYRTKWSYNQLHKWCNRLYCFVTWKILLEMTWHSRYWCMKALEKFEIKNEWFLEHLRIYIIWIVIKYLFITINSF